MPWYRTYPCLWYKIALGTRCHASPLKRCARASTESVEILMAKQDVLILWVQSRLFCKAHQMNMAEKTLQHYGWVREGTQRVVHDVTCSWFMTQQVDSGSAVYIVPISSMKGVWWDIMLVYDQDRLRKAEVSQFLAVAYIMVNKFLSKLAYWWLLSSLKLRF